MEKYKFIKNIGDGAYGSVSKASVKGTREYVAVKKLKPGLCKWNEYDELSEVTILRDLNHKNVIRLKEVIHEGDDIYLIFDCMECTLIDFLHRNPSSHPLVVSYIRQAVEGLAYVHRSGYMHRDIKPENILLNNETCKISDFGLAKRLGCNRNTDYISTRWYRSPELLLHSPNYDTSADMYAIGCIIAEIYLGRALFPGTNEKDQLERITCVLGTPNDWNDGLILARKAKYKFMNHQGAMFNEFIQAPRQAIRLIELLVRWNPDQRYTAQQALSHPFLSPQEKILPAYSHSNSSGRLSNKNFY
jgi:serine/threonine protein kinase